MNKESTGDSSTLLIFYVRPIQYSRVWNMIEDKFVQTEAGYCCYDVYWEPTPLIYNLYVYKEYRRQGHAKTLLVLAIQAIRDTGYSGEICIEPKPRENSIPSTKLVDFYKSFNLKIL